MTRWTSPSLPEQLQRYWAFNDRMILKGERLLIPHSTRKYILSKLHEGHWGIEKTWLQAKSSWWHWGYGERLLSLPRDQAVTALRNSASVWDTFETLANLGYRLVLLWREQLSHCCWLLFEVSLHLEDASWKYQCCCCQRNLSIVCWTGDSRTHHKWQW